MTKEMIEQLLTRDADGEVESLAFHIDEESLTTLLGCTDAAPENVTEFAEDAADLFKNNFHLCKDTTDADLLRKSAGASPLNPATTWDDVARILLALKPVIAAFDEAEAAGKRAGVISNVHGYKIMDRLELPTVAK